MKVTIINNGTISVVLKPETPAEVIAVQQLGKQPVSIVHHEKLQILNEPIPDALVISVDQKQD